MYPQDQTLKNQDLGASCDVTGFLIPPQPTTQTGESPRGLWYAKLKDNTTPGTSSKWVINPAYVDDMQAELNRTEQHRMELVNALCRLSEKLKASQVELESLKRSALVSIKERDVLRRNLEAAQANFQCDLPRIMFDRDIAQKVLAEAKRREAVLRGALDTARKDSRERHDALQKAIEENQSLSCQLNVAQAGKETLRIRAEQAEQKAVGAAEREGTLKAARDHAINARDRARALLAKSEEYYGLVQKENAELKARSFITPRGLVDLLSSAAEKLDAVRTGEDFEVSCSIEAAKLRIMMARIAREKPDKNDLIFVGE